MPRLCHFVAPFLLLIGIGNAAADDLQAIVAKAIKASGGEENINKYQAVRSKSKGTLHIGNDLGFTQEVSAQLPGQFRETLNLEINNQKLSVVTVFNGQKAWISANGQTKELDGKILDEIKEAVHAIRVNRLTSLKNTKSYVLSSLGELKVDGRPAVGIKVDAEGHRAVNLFFDKETGLLAKVERRAFDASSNQEVTEEKILKDYQEVEGMKSPRKVAILHDGKKFMEVEVIEVKMLEKLDDSEFAMP